LQWAGSSVRIDTAIRSPGNPHQFIGGAGQKAAATRKHHAAGKKAAKTRSIGKVEIKGVPAAAPAPGLQQPSFQAATTSPIDRKQS